jgi:hypothetical protein
MVAVQWAVASLYVIFGLMVEKLWGFEDFSPSSGMLSATVVTRKICPNLPRTAQNCQKLPKFAQRWNFEILPKIEISVFFKNKNFHV